MPEGLDPTLQQALELDFSPVVVLTREGMPLFANRPFRETPRFACIMASLQDKVGLELIQRGLRTTTPVPARLALLDSANTVKCTVGRMTMPDGTGAVLLRMLPEGDSTRFAELTRRMHQIESEIARRIRSEHEARLMFEHMSDGVALISGTGYFLRANPSLKRLLSHFDKSIVGQCLTDVIDLGVMQEKMERSGSLKSWLSSIRNLTFEATVAGEDATLHPVEINLTRADAAGQDVVLMVLRDLSETRRFAEASARAEVLEKACLRAEAGERARTRFLGVLSHEMRTPISAIIATAELLSADDTLSEEQAKLIAMIELSAENALDQVSNVLEIVRTENRHELGPKAEYVLANVVQDVIRQIDPIAWKRGTRILFSHSGPRDQRVMGYPPLIFRIVQNLLSNAVKFAPGGEVTVSLSETPSIGRSSFELQVEDNGCGIEPNRLSNIFDTFETGAQYENIREGAGLGLAIVKRAVDELEGRIDVSSELGRGTRFRVSFRQESAPRRNLAVPKANRKDTGDAPQPLSVLVVDDQDLNREILGKTLTKLGMEVFEARDGSEGLTMAVEKRPDLVLMDLHMPTMSGFDAVREIRKLTARGDLFIIGVTANLSEDTEAQCREADMNGVLEKPIRKQQLLEILRSLEPKGTQKEDPKGISGRRVDKT
jgi:signal transduction histidine kinase/ActR/RegA family two-component response regulator